MIKLLSLLLTLCFSVPQSTHQLWSVVAQANQDSKTKELNEVTKQLETARQLHSVGKYKEAIVAALRCPYSFNLQLNHHS
jgi:hypothetical protein